MFRFLSQSRSDRAAPFAEQYRSVREQDGYRETAPEYYRMLPVVTQSDHAAEWRIRRKLRTLSSARSGVWQGPIRALISGRAAGGSRIGLRPWHHAVPDRLAMRSMGSARRHYPMSFAVVEADFDAAVRTGV
jgi:hypothetical protein